MFIHEQVLRNLIRAYAEMWAEEWGGGEDDWPDMLAERRGSDNDPAVREALEALGETWKEFVMREDESQKKHSA